MQLQNIHLKKEDFTIITVKNPIKKTTKTFIRPRIYYTGVPKIILNPNKQFNIYKYENLKNKSNKSI